MGEGKNCGAGCLGSAFCCKNCRLMWFKFMCPGHRDRFLQNSLGSGQGKYVVMGTLTDLFKRVSAFVVYHAYEYVHSC